MAKESRLLHHRYLPAALNDLPLHPTTSPRKKGRVEQEHDPEPQHPLSLTGLVSANGNCRRSRQLLITTRGATCVLSRSFTFLICSACVLRASVRA